MGQLHSTMVGVTTLDEQLEPDYPHLRASRAWLFPSVWTGSELIVWGGIVNTAWPFVSTNTGGRYNPATNSWTSTTMQSAPSCTGLAASRVDGFADDRVGGGTMDPDGVNTNTGGMYWANAGGGGQPSPANPRLAAAKSDECDRRPNLTSHAHVERPAPAGGAVVMLSSSNRRSQCASERNRPRRAISASFTVNTIPVLGNERDDWG